MDQPNCWDLGSLAALAASMKAEAADLRAVVPHAVGRGRAWMVLSWRAGYLESAASRVIAAIDGAKTAHEKRLALQRQGLLDRDDYAGHCWRVIESQQSGLWHNAFAFRQGHSASEEIQAAVHAALAAESRAETGERQPAPQG